MNIPGVVGFIAMWALIFAGMGISNLASFIDPPSILIVMGGTGASLFLAYPLSSMKGVLSVVKQAFFNTGTDTAATIRLLVDFADKARREGILSLEDAAQKIEDPFLKKGIQLAVDGTEPELIRDILRTEMVYIEERHATSAGIFKFAATMAPGMGMIGTLIGLILMLGNMADVASIGPSMAVALLTTMYGSMVANGVCGPIENILKLKSADEILVKSMMLEGIMSLQSGDNPHIVEQKLAAFIDPVSRAAASKEE
jgi:chemotaxis protein MotA